MQQCTKNTSESDQNRTISEQGDYEAVTQFNEELKNSYREGRRARTDFYIFFAIGGMIPSVESLHTDRAFWFNDLTISDPTFLLPAMMISVTCYEH